MKNNEFKKNSIFHVSSFNENCPGPVGILANDFNKISFKKIMIFSVVKLMKFCLFSIKNHKQQHY